MSKSIQALEELFLKRHGAVETEEGSFELYHNAHYDSNGAPLPWTLVQVLSIDNCDPLNKWDVCLGKQLIYCAKNLIDALMYIGKYVERKEIIRATEERIQNSYKNSVGGPWA